MKKTTDKDISITKVSERTIVTINGKQVSADGLGADNDLMALLKNNNLDSNMISDILQATSDTQQTNSANTANNKFTKIDCDSCNRTVSYGKGTCMYCGNNLVLQSTKETSTQGNKVDEKYLNTNEINTEQKETNADLNYIDRLKDI